MIHKFGHVLTKYWLILKYWLIKRRHHPCILHAAFDNLPHILDPKPKLSCSLKRCTAHLFQAHDQE